MISTRTTRNRAVTVFVLLMACLGLTACEAPEPTITWFGNDTAVNVGPKLYCTLTANPAPDCSQTDGPEARLSLNRGDPVQVNIPAEVAEQPWLLVYSYVDDPDSYRSPVMTDGNTLSYVVRPLAGEQLKQIDLQVLILTAATDGAPQYTPIQAWVLVVDPA